MNHDNIFVVIMAGGVGTRLWPMSSSRNPKQTRKLLDEDSLLEKTISRALHLVPSTNIVVLTGPSMETMVRSQTAMLPSENILVEPSPKNTAPCVALALGFVQAKQGTHMVIWPCDHHIVDEAGWLSIHRRALVRTEHADLVLIGIQPTSPATGYGYIQHKSGVVCAFHEKPRRARAEQLIDLGALWNAGVCVVRIERLFSLFLEHLQECTAADLISHWEDLPSISLDYGILEKSSSLEVISYDGGWSDLGDWDAVAQFLQGDGTHKMGGEVRLQSIESYDCIVQTSKELDVALIGVSDLTIVFGTEGLLIMRNGEGQSLRKVKSTTK